MIQFKQLLFALLLTGPWLTACGPTDPNDRFIQGSWIAAGDIGDSQHSWYLEWTFKNGTFVVTGYPPLRQQGRYRIQSGRGGQLTLLLTDQSGDWPTEIRTIEIVIDSAQAKLTIDQLGPFSRTDLVQNSMVRISNGASVMGAAAPVKGPAEE